MDCTLINKTIRETNEVGSTSRAELRYLVRLDQQSGPVTDTNAAVALALSESPASFDLADRSGASIAANHGAGVYEVAVEYRRETTSERKETAHAYDETWRFECSSTRILTYRAEGLVQVLTDPDAPASYGEPGLAVNWNGRSGSECEVSGVHVMVPEMRESCTKIFSPGHVTNHFKRQIMELTGCVNVKSFHGWKAGEVLFLGAEQGEQFENSNGKKLVKVKYRFAIRPNRTGVSADGLGTLDVDGWDYLWTIPWPEPGAHAYASGAAVVSRLYRRADLTKLGIGR